MDEPDKDLLMHNDFETVAGWVADPATLTQEQAHSGRYSLKVDKDHQYSLTYYSLLGQLSPTRIRGVRVDAWAYEPNKDNSVQLRIGLNDAAGGKLMMGDGIAYNVQVGEPNKWVKISKEIVFPPNVNYSSQLVMYLWNAGGAGAGYLDDVQLTALH
ncbi:hypothetical protein A8B98_07780 [Hymenobacter sp. UV11]|nr:hypothetical protein A8B98_07780 [Hymenobacter sp. UV11]